MQNQEQEREKLIEEDVPLVRKKIKTKKYAYEGTGFDEKNIVGECLEDVGLEKGEETMGRGKRKKRRTKKYAESEEDITDLWMVRRRCEVKLFKLRPITSNSSPSGKM